MNVDYIGYDELAKEHFAKMNREFKVAAQFERLMNLTEGKRFLQRLNDWASSKVRYHTKMAELYYQKAHTDVLIYLYT